MQVHEGRIASAEFPGVNNRFARIVNQQQQEKRYETRHLLELI